MNQLNNESNSNKVKKLSVKNVAIFGAIAFALLATMMPSALTATAFELNAGDGGDGGDGGEGGNTGQNDIQTGAGGAGGTGGNGGNGGNGGSNNTGIEGAEFLAPLDEVLQETVGYSISGEVDADGGDGGSGGDADGGDTNNEGDISTGNADGGEAGSGGNGGNAIAICNTLGCI